MKTLISRLIGSTEDTSFEHRLYHGICIIGSILLLGLIITNIINQLKFDLVICCIGIFFSGILYYFARYRKKYQIFGLYGIYLVLIVVSYFNDNGIYGPIPYGIIVILVFALVLSPVKWSIRIFIFHIVVFSAVLLVEYFFPHLITNPYKTQNLLYNDLVESLIAVIIFSFISIYYLRYTYEQEREKNLKQQAIIESANQQKSMFFINLSHEIKTPLTLVENYLEKYINKKGEDEDIMIISQCIKKMRRDILDYLNVENIEKGNISYEKIQPLLMSRFLDEKIKLFLPYAETKDIVVNCIIEPEVFVDVNLNGIDHVLNNLLENAVKYTPENGKINIGLKNEEKNARLTIQNSGSKIPDDQLIHLFEPFYQLSNEKLNAQGIGMGLYIVKKILDSTGGEIHANSSDKEGVSFTVLLPLNLNHENIVYPKQSVLAMNINAKIQKAFDSSYFTNRKSLFIIEDNEELLGYLAQELSNEYNIFLARNGKIAIEKLEIIPVPDLIVSDIMMDQMNGYEVLSKTIADERFAHIPFIFLTAKDGTNDKIAGLEMGALDFISKPFSMAELKMKIKAIINEKTRISEAVIRNLKKQFTDNHFLKIRQQNDELLNINALRYNITSREKEVIIFIQQGLKYEEIGEKLYISERTVIRHVQNVYKKTASSTKIDMLQKLFAFENTI